ncbi:MAG: ribosome-associated translation inhibitor RaiA [Xanthomonadaceae bacterium]|jgi:ribosomal subunit interface protein|nr:ribosome-associated translation inhibitor RaiA [Xanthomonadaceae bacterium]
MDISTSISFDGMDASEALRQMILERARRLGRFAGDILACDVVVSAREHRHRHGNRYNVHARVTLRDQVVEIGRLNEANASYEDPYVAANQTFDALRRRIEDHVRRRRGDVKTHADDARP